MGDLESPQEDPNHGPRRRSGGFRYRNPRHTPIGGESRPPKNLSIFAASCSGSMLSTGPRSLSSKVPSCTNESCIPSTKEKDGFADCIKLWRPNRRPERVTNMITLTQFFPPSNLHYFGDNKHRNVPLAMFRHRIGSTRWTGTWMRWPYPLSSEVRLQGCH
ncbi:hypothetical protein CPC08DRAFT_712732 [Agrocybe pediades]|nr:hypothetical protein CPC08DRAFT_712732 [Agrocybe pediades]